jgi:hypothetical protein
MLAVSLPAATEFKFRMLCERSGQKISKRIEQLIEKDLEQESTLIHEAWLEASGQKES